LLRPGLALLSILLAVPASAGSHFHGGGFHGGGFHGQGFDGQGFHGQGFHGQGFHGDGFHGGAAHDGDFAFHRSVGRARNLFVVYGYGNCGFGFDCGVYDPGYAYGYGGGAGNSVSSSDGSSSSGDNSGGYVPDPVGAEIPPVIFPTQCWVRRAGYDPSGAYVGQVLIDLCHRSDSVTVTRAEARAKPPNTGSGAPPSPR
jgi:hypothetical protein